MSSKVVFNFKTKENLTGIVREMNNKSSDIWDRYKCGYIWVPIKNGRFVDIDLLKVHGVVIIIMLLRIRNTLF